LARLGIKHPASIGHLVDGENQNALFTSVGIKGETDLVALEISAYLINSAGCNPHHEDSMNQTPLFYAAREGNELTMRLLVQ
jgi:hypothetical protein